MKAKVQDLTGLALVWAVAINSGFREVHLFCGFHHPAKAKIPTQVMVSMKKDSSFWFQLDGDWTVRVMQDLCIGAKWYSDTNSWVAQHTLGKATYARTLVEAVAKCWLAIRGIVEVELPPELTAGSNYPPENEHGY